MQSSQSERNDVPDNQGKNDATDDVAHWSQFINKNTFCTEIYSVQYHINI